MDEPFGFFSDRDTKDKIHTINARSDVPAPLNSLRHTKKLIKAGEESGEEFLKNDWKDL